MCTQQVSRSGIGLNHLHDKSLAPLFVSFGLQPKETMAVTQPSNGASHHPRQAKKPFKLNYDQFEIL